MLEAQVFGGGFVELLIDMLHSSTAAVKEAAAKALSNLAASRTRQQAIARAGCIEPLLALLQFGTPGGREASACALNNLSLVASVQVEVAELGGIPALVRHISHGILVMPY